jgi:hypothetical protein
MHLAIASFERVIQDLWLVLQTTFFILTGSSLLLKSENVC